MDYKVITVENKYLYEAEEEFMQIVNRHLQDGWNLQGGVSITSRQYGNYNYYTFAQAMVK